MEQDINHFVKSCHLCQEQQQQLVKIPPSTTHTPSVFEVLHVDVMHMTPASNGHKYIAHERDSLMSYVEACALKQETGRAIGLWIYEDILCQWGSLRKIVTDNGAPMKAGVEWIASK